MHADEPKGDQGTQSLLEKMIESKKYGILRLDSTFAFPNTQSTEKIVRDMKDSLHAAAFKEGSRNVGLQMLHALEEIDPQARQRLRDADTEREVTRNDEDDEFQWV